MAELKLNEVKSALEEMRPRFDAGFTGADKAYLDRVYYRLFGKEYPHKGTGCRDCYRDQYVIINAQLKKITELPNIKYALKNGVVLAIPFTNKYISGVVAPEIAEEILRKNPQRANLFSILPEDWQKRCENARKDGEAVESTPKKKKAHRAQKNEPTETETATEEKGGEVEK